MTPEMPPEIICYIVKWCDSGNEPRRAYAIVGLVPECVLMRVGGDLCQLNSAGIAIAQLARFADNACDVADIVAQDWDTVPYPLVQKELQALEKTRRGLLGDLTPEPKST